MKHLGIILASIILMLALATEAKNPHAREIKAWKMELALIEEHLEQLPNDPALNRERKHLQEQQMHIVKILQELDPKGDYSAHLPKSAEQPTADNGTTSNVAEPEDVVSEVQSKANPNEEITLTVTSDGPTKDEAIKNALRTAIEQAYGAFVSANTTILNDELVKDEIVTVSNGSIKEYKILSEYQKADGTGYGVTANATVSLPHLITYAKSHGSECEFAGKTFGMEIKMFNLQKENELKALYNMIPTIQSFVRNTWTFELSVGQPKIETHEVSISPNKGFDHVLYNRMDFGYHLNITPDFQYEIDPGMIHVDSIYGNGRLTLGKDTETLKLLEVLNGQCAVIPMTIEWIPSKETHAAHNHIWIDYTFDLLREIALSHETYRKYDDYGFDVNSILIDGGNDVIRLRNSEEDIATWEDSLYTSISTIFNAFTITDNTGQVSFIPTDSLYRWNNNRWNDNIRFIKLNNDYRTKTYSFGADLHKFCVTNSGLLGVGAHGLFKNPFIIKKSPKKPDLSEMKYYLERYIPSWGIEVYVPLSEIGKYSSFKVVPKE